MNKKETVQKALSKGIFEINPSLKSKLQDTAKIEEINGTASKLKDKAEEYLIEIAKMKHKQQKKIENDYETEFFNVKKDFDQFIEENNKDDLREELEKEKNETINERAKFLQETFNLSLIFSEKKAEMRLTERKDNELDEELRFLMGQIEFADSQKLKLMNKIEEVDEEFNELEIKNVRMEESDILKILPVASKTRDYSLPDFLDTRTKTEFNKFKIKRRADNPLHRKKAPPARVYESGYSQSQIHNSQQLFPTQMLTENPEKTFNDLTSILKFVTENKYVIEAIFENVLLESQLLNHPFTSFNDSEKKVLMETLLLNEEFKEYVYQKIAKDEINKLHNAINDDFDVSKTDKFMDTNKHLERLREEDERPTGQIDDDIRIGQEIDSQDMGRSSYN